MSGELLRSSEAAGKAEAEATSLRQRLEAAEAASRTTQKEVEGAREKLGAALARAEALEPALKKAEAEAADLKRSWENARKEVHCYLN